MAGSTGLTGLSALELDDDDDQVLGESSGSDATLSGESNGINIISPSDNGVALSGALESKVGDDFQLMSLKVHDGGKEQDSSQVIEGDDVSEETAGSPHGNGLGDPGMIVEDFGCGLSPGAVPVSVASVAEKLFSVWNVLGLAGCMVLLGPY